MRSKPPVHVAQAEKADVGQPLAQKIKGLAHASAVAHVLHGGKELLHVKTSAVNFSIGHLQSRKARGRTRHKARPLEISYVAVGRIGAHDEGRAVAVVGIGIGVRDDGHKVACPVLDHAAVKPGA